MNLKSELWCTQLSTTNCPQANHKKILKPKLIEFTWTFEILTQHLAYDYRDVELVVLGVLLYPNYFVKLGKKQSLGTPIFLKIWKKQHLVPPIFLNCRSNILQKSLAPPIFYTFHRPYKKPELTIGWYEIFLSFQSIWLI